MMLKSAGKTLAFATAVSLMVVGSVSSQAQTSARINFARGASDATVQGTITGRQYRDYLVTARAGQFITVSMSQLSGSPYFNIMPPGSTGEAIFIGSSEGNNAVNVELPSTGTYRIRVYQMRSAGRRGTAARYSLNIAIN
jgi:hypothetical protein